MSTSLLRQAIVLGLLTAVGPLAIDMYLPALPAIGRDLDADPRAVQVSLMAFFIALGAGQLLCGPLSDLYGRRKPLMAGLTIFIAASLGCAVAPTIEALIVCRVLQGIGASAIMVIPRAVVRDLHGGPPAARLMSQLMTVYSVSPILAPVAGSWIAGSVGWRGIFCAIAALAALAAALVLALLPETRPLALRRQSNLGSALAGYRSLLGDARIIPLALIASLTLAGFFVYVANSSFVFTTHFGVSPRTYAVLFALNAVSFVTLSQMNGWLASRFGLRSSVRAAITSHFAIMLLLLALTFIGVDRLDVLSALLFVGFGLNGLIVPSTFVLAMEEQPAFAGTASALIGTLNFVGGAVVVAIVAPFANGAPLPMVAGIAGCSAIVFALAMLALGRRKAIAPARDNSSA